MSASEAAWLEGPEADQAARWAVASIHHIYPTPREGYACLCGAKPITARATTEHIIDTFIAARAADGGGRS